ncbi:hypothetical protein EHQ53_13970 [Leptospira langatensis]|uniref:Phage baseplate assembly protein V n=1 Tax=Leptospira langatensis TaxID=2484983 RepID=A0ABY2MD74_9LEPT|nr:hypothetical protein [Leptospira langatensis]TGL39624.1 hypothetical protein EHQ53_13970 [Leptospira langatensis]
MQRPFVQDDIIEVINLIAGELLQYYRRYIGIVKQVNSDLSILVHSPDFHTKEDDPQSWIPLVPGNQNHSAIIPKIGESWEFGFYNGNPESGRYYNQFSPDYESPNGSQSKQVIWEKDASNYILFDSTANKLTLKRGNTSIEITGSQINVSDGVTTYNLIGHIHDTPTGPSGPARNP